VVDYAFILRDRNGGVTVEHDRHEEGLFAPGDWLTWFEEAGLPARVELDSSGREIFIGTPAAIIQGTRTRTEED
jgi:hypothetical protein